MNYYFINKNNTKIIFQIIINYINLSQYELARSLLYNLITSNLLNENDFKRKKSIADRSIEEKFYYLKKTLKFMRKFLPYGCSPLQIFSNELSSAHFLFKIINDYNHFVNLIFCNLIKYETYLCKSCDSNIVLSKSIYIKNYKKKKNFQKGKEKEKKKINNILNKFHFILKKKYISKYIKEKISFDILLVTIILYKDIYSYIFKNTNFNFFSIETVQFLRRFYNLFLKTRELLKKRKSENVLSEYEKDLNERCIVISLFNLIVPYNKKCNYKQNNKIINNKINNKNCVDKITKKNFLQKIDKLILDNLITYYEKEKIISEDKKKKERKNKESISKKENEIQIEIKKKKKKFQLKNFLNVIYVHPLYTINQMIIFNYINTYEEEVHLFYEKNIFSLLFRELFYLLFFFPSLTIQLFKVFCLNRKFFDILLELFLINNKDNFYDKKLKESEKTKITKMLKNDAIHINVNNIKRSNNNYNYNKIGIANKISESRCNKIMNSSFHTTIESTKNRENYIIKKSYIIFLQAYYYVIHIYVDVLIEKLKRNDLTNYYNFIYLLKFNNLFINNIFLFSLCSTTILLYEEEKSKNDNLKKKYVITKNSSPYSLSYNNIENTLCEENIHLLQLFKMQFDICNKIINKIYNFLILLVFYYNNESKILYFNDYSNENKEINQEGERFMIVLNDIVLYFYINYKLIENIFYYYFKKINKKSTMINYYNNKCIIYEIFMSTNTFYCVNNKKIHNIFLYLFNYVDDLYIKSIIKNDVYSDIQLKKNEDLLFYINISRIKKIHFLNYLFNICEEQIDKQNFLHLDELLNNFKCLKNLSIIYCLENNEDVNIKQKCLSQLKSSKENIYLYNYIKDIKVKLKIACAIYDFFKKNEKISKKLENKLSKTIIYLKLKTCSNAFILSELNLLQNLNYRFLVKLKNNIRNPIYKNEVNINNNFIIFYLIIKNTYLQLKRSEKIEEIKKYYKLITYGECKIKVLLYIFILLFRYIEYENVKPKTFIYLIEFLYSKLKVIKNEKSLFFSNLKILLFQIVEDVHIRLCIFFEKYHRQRKLTNIKVEFNKNEKVKKKSYIKYIKKCYKKKIYNLKYINYHKIENEKKDRELNDSCIKKLNENKGFLKKVNKKRFSHYNSINHFFSSNFLHLMKNVLQKKLGVTYLCNYKKGLFKKKKKLYIYCLLTKFEKNFSKNNFFCSNETLYFDNLKNKNFEKYFFELIFSDPQEYIYKNIEDKKKNELNIFICNRYKSYFSKNYIYNLLFYIELNSLFKKMYVSNSNLFFKKKGNKIKFNNKMLIDFLNYIIFYYKKYKRNELNRYIFVNSEDIDFFLLYNFLNICISYSNMIEKGVTLLKFLKNKIIKIITKIELKKKKKSSSFFNFLLYFINRLHVLINIKKKKNNNKDEKNRYYFDITKKSNRKKNKSILLSRYLLLKSNSLKVQTKLIEKYFIDLYKKKDFLKDMFFFFNNLKRKNNKYLNITYNDMNTSLEKYCLLLLENDDSLYINYLFYFFIYSNILINNIYNSMTDNISEMDFYEYIFTKNKENLKITFEQSINYNLFYLFSIDIYIIIKYLMFVCNSYENVKKLCSLFFIHYHRIIVENIQTHYLLNNDMFYNEDLPILKNIFVVSFFVKNPIKEIKYNIDFKNIYENKKIIEQFLTSNFLFLLKDSHVLKKLKERILTRTKKRKICNLNFLYNYYIEFLISKCCKTYDDFYNEKNNTTGKNGKNENKINTYTFEENKNDVYKDDYTEGTRDTEKKDKLMNIFICLEKCDYYFPFIFNILYPFYFSKKYKYLNKFIKERYNYINKVYKIFKNEKKKDDSILEIKNESIQGVYFLKYYDLLNLNNYTKCILYTTIYDNQHNIDCIYIYQILKEKKNIENIINIIESKLNNFYFTYLAINKNEIFEYKLKANKLYEYTLNDNLELSFQLKIIINIVMKDNILNKLCFSQVKLLLESCYKKKEKFLKKKENHKFFNCNNINYDEINCYNFETLPDSFFNNIIKLNIYYEIFKVIKEVRKNLKETKKKYCWTNHYKIILKKNESNDEVLDFIIKNKLFKYYFFYLKFKNCINNPKNLIKCNSTYVLYLWNSNNLKKKKKIIMFLNSLKKIEIRKILSSIYYKSCYNDIYLFYYFILQYFKYPYIRKFYLLSLIYKHLGIDIVKIKYKNIIFLLLKYNKINLIKYILKYNLFQTNISTFYYYAFLYIHIDIKKQNENRILTEKCNNKKYDKIPMPYNLLKCISILQLGILIRYTNFQFIYSTFLFILQSIYDRICENIRKCINSKENVSIKKKKDKIIKIRRINELNINTKKEIENVKIKKKYSLFHNFHKYYRKNKNRSIYIRKYCIVNNEDDENVINDEKKININNSNKINVNDNKDSSKYNISTNILIYTFYKICFFFYENFKELKNSSNLLCTLLPLLIYVRISLNYQISIKSIIKLNIKELVDFLKVKNYNICNNLIHRIFSCSYYNMNSFDAINEPCLFYSLFNKNKKTKNYKVIKNIISLLLYKSTFTKSISNNMQLKNLEKINNFYIYNYDNKTYIYRRFIDTNKIIYDELKEEKEKKYLNNLFFENNEWVYGKEEEKNTINNVKYLVRVCKRFKIISKQEILNKIQNIRFNIIVFYCELLNKNKLSLYAVFNLFFSFFFNFHYCNNIYKNYKNIFSYFNSFYVLQKIKSCEKINNINVEEIEIFKKIRRENCSKMNSYCGPNKNEFLHNCDMKYKIIIQTKNYNYHSYFILKNNILSKIKKNSLFYKRKINYIYNLLNCNNLLHTHNFLNRHNDLLYGKIIKNKLNDDIYEGSSNIYSVFSSIFVKKHIINNITFSYFYNYYNNIHFTNLDEKLEKINTLTQKKLFMYLINLIKNPYVMEKKLKYEKKKCFLFFDSSKCSIYEKKYKETKNANSKIKKKDICESENTPHNLINYKKLFTKKTTFIYSNYIKQKRIINIIDTFKKKLENFQSHIKLLHNNSLEKRIFEFFISIELINYYEYFFYDINNYSYPLCYKYGSNNPYVLSEYFKENVNEIYANTAYLENKKIINIRNLNKTRIFLFLISLLLPHSTKHIKLRNYNNSKFDNYLNVSKNYFSLTNLINVYAKYDLHNKCFKLITQNDIGSLYFTYIIKRAYKYNYIYKIFQKISYLKNYIFHHEMKCYLLKKKKYYLLSNYLIFSNDYLNAAIVCIYNYSISQNIDMKYGYLNNALINFTMIIKNLEISKKKNVNNSKNSDMKVSYDNFILLNNKRKNKSKNKRLYYLSNFNTLFEELQKNKNQLISTETILRCIDLITLQYNLLNINICTPINIINCKKIDINFCINVLIFKRIYNLADNVINIFKWNYIFTYCLSSLFCLLINKNLNFLHDIIFYIKIKLNNYDINIFILHVVYLYIEYKNKLKQMYEHIEEIYNKKGVLYLKKGNINKVKHSLKEEAINEEKNKLKEEAINDEKNKLKEENDNEFNLDDVNNILTYINDNDILFYSHTLIYIHDKNEYKNLYKNMKSLLFTNINKIDIYKTIMCTHKYTSKNKKINYNFIYDNKSYFKKIKRNSFSIKLSKNIYEDYHFSKVISLARKYPDNIKKNIISEIIAIYNLHFSKK
ncbi:conserved Plasmodium protein, unknown function [Plasmodium relictum]|uniref:Uncharacterized protein n=1 Tax=Plasmodium relictum TaxID=85471 RepID=A0A1J1H176_PLARL|nr:conserved Plasmodium protein, unknown function [Plasmodium relictum]CRG98602.1 conserved Plasmodium protein, unknown function [Plasmodium relictum]